MSDFYDSFYKTASTQTKRIQKRLLKKGDSLGDSSLLISSGNQSLKRKTEHIKRFPTASDPSESRSKFRHTVVASALKPNLLPTINSRHSSEDVDIDKPGEKEEISKEKSSTNNKSNSFDSKIKAKSSKDSKRKRAEEKRKQENQTKDEFI